MNDLGTYGEHDGRPAVRFARDYAHPIERVWAAVTEPGHLAAWFPQTVTIELRAGGTVTYADPSDPADVTTGSVLVCDPPRRLAMTWYDDELHLDLAELPGGGCRLTLIDVLENRGWAARTATGWSMCLDALDAVIDGRPAGDEAGDDTGDEAWRPYWDAYVAAGLPADAAIPG